MPFFSSGGFTGSTESDTRGDQQDFWSQLPQVVGGLAQSVTAVVSAVRGEPPPPIRVQVGTDPGTQRIAGGLGVGALLIGAVFVFFLLRR